MNQPSQIKTVVAEMQKFRGTIEGGICVRRIEDFVPETERRYFVLSGKPFAALADEEIPEIVFECAKRIESQFFSVDVIKRRDGTKRIVEIGDGQMGRCQILLDGQLNVLLNCGSTINEPIKLIAIPLAQSPILSWLIIIKIKLLRRKSLVKSLLFRCFTTSREKSD
ncbi:ATP-grasp domain-containing protein [Nostoc sp. FACHB-888]|uniref:ATP-grasp domain-containing protein n=1 Tax=Nostoc sp. FACHB-888 TaxID=2692842 RepID=UPI003220540C